MKMRFQGCYTAVITPFDEKGGFDKESFEKNLQFQKESGARGVIVNGTTGESPTTHDEEKKEMLEKAVEVFSGSATVAGTGSSSTEKTIHATREARDMGIDSALLVDCYYNGPSSTELRREYYEPVAMKFTEMSFIPYVIPGRTGCELQVEDLAVLNEVCSNVCAVKEATGNIERMKKTRSVLGKEFCIMSGDDGITLEMMSSPEIRASGVISVASNVAPKAVEQLCAAMLAGEEEKARELNQALTPLFDVITVKKAEQLLVNGKVMEVQQKYRNPLPYKALMKALGMDSGKCRAPLGMVSQSAMQALRDAVKRTWDENPWILEPIHDFYEIDLQERIEGDECWKHHY